jgi:SsrA-binding protein
MLFLHPRMSTDKERFKQHVNIKNRQAFFNFEILDKLVAGISLTGTEIKSIREGRVNLQDGFCYFNRGEAFVKGISILPYTEGTYNNHEANRERKLLLKKSEINKLEAKVDQKGFTLLPLRLFINDRGFAKLEIGLAKGKKLRDKREGIKERDLKRELNRIKLA